MSATLTFDIERCKSCGLCVAFCPKKILELDQSTTNKQSVHPVKITDVEACIACAGCALMCPEGVIAIYKD